VHDRERAPGERGEATERRIGVVRVWDVVRQRAGLTGDDRLAHARDRIVSSERLVIAELERQVRAKLSGGRRRRTSQPCESASLDEFRSPDDLIPLASVSHSASMKLRSSPLQVGFVRDPLRNISDCSINVELRYFSDLVGDLGVGGFRHIDDRCHAVAICAEAAQRRTRSKSPSSLARIAQNEK
jgi:hypothetical protein